MRAARIVSLTAILVAGLVGSAMAQRVTAPGVYPAQVGVDTGLLPLNSLPAGFPELGKAVYVGEVSISLNLDGSYNVQFKGETADGAKLNANAQFNSSWTGLKFGPLVTLGPGSDFITGIDVANLDKALVNGVGVVDGRLSRLLVKVGPGGAIEDVRVLPAPGNLR